MIKTGICPYCKDNTDKKLFSFLTGFGDDEKRFWVCGKHMLSDLMPEDLREFDNEYLGYERINYDAINERRNKQ